MIGDSSALLGSEPRPVASIRGRAGVVLLARRRLADLAARSVDLPVEGDELPREFRLFKSGENETTKGVFLFDAEAARQVMANAEAHGVDLMVDLEHLSLDQESRSFDPDARAWLRLEVRNGELWAVDVRWTDDGARRLKAKTQRYISPAFATDDENRVIEIVNIALTAMPATHNTPALVAAGRRLPMTLAQRIALLAARLTIAKGRLAKLADDAGDAGDGPKGKGAQLATDIDSASAALDALRKAQQGGDVDQLFEAMQTAQNAIDELEKAMAAFGMQDSSGAGGAGDAPAGGSPDAAAKLADDAKKTDEAKQMARRDAEIVSLRKELAKRTHDEEVTRLAAETDERRSLVASLVRIGRETIATAWADHAATTPRGSLATMPLTELRDRVKLFGGAPTTLSRVGPQPPTHHVEIGDGPSMSETEAVYVKARHGMMLSKGRKLRTLDDTMIRYEQANRRQLLGAQESNDRERLKLLTTPLRGDVIKLHRDAGLVMLASTPVQPIEQFGASSQIALQAFRLEYNVSLASEPGTWAEEIGQMLSDGSMKVTFPISYDATEYKEVTGQNAAANQPLSFDIEVTQRQFFGAKQVELRRLIKGDFAYVQRWSQAAAEMAKARVFLRNLLVQLLLASGTTGYWGVTAKQPTGIDGQPFFSASHANNPADASRKLRGSSVFSNYQATPSPLAAATLTTEKNNALQVAAPDGRELGILFDGMLHPSSLQETAYNLLKVQDLILDAKTTLNGVSNAFGQTRNPHFNSGLELVRAMDLAGSDTTADWYLYSREGIARGMPPWVICEDPTEEIRMWDENSDFYKKTSEIKVESRVFLNAVLAFPHCIRLIKGS